MTPSTPPRPQTDLADIIRLIWLQPAEAMKALLRIEAFGSGELVPLRLNSVQRILHERVEDQLEREGYVRRVVLKPRRSGLSTYWIARFFLKSLTRSNQRILLVAKTSHHLRIHKSSRHLWILGTNQRILLAAKTGSDHKA